MRVRENAESIAFYGGEDNEARLLGRRLRSVVENFGQLLLASRNLNFFTSFYRWGARGWWRPEIWAMPVKRYFGAAAGACEPLRPLGCRRRFLISVLPAAVIAPLYFRGEIEFGVINQSSSGACPQQTSALL